MLNFIKDAKAVRVANAAIAAQTDVLSSVIDTQGYDSVAFIAILGDVVTGCALKLELSQNDANSTSGGDKLAGAASFTAGASDADNKMLIADVMKPRKRYVFATLERKTANAVVDGIIAILYNGHEVPDTIDASVVAAVFQNDPAPAA